MIFIIGFTIIVFMMGLILVDEISFTKIITFFEESDIEFLLMQTSQLAIEKARRSRLYLSILINFTFLTYVVVTEVKLESQVLYLAGVVAYFSYKFYYYQLQFAYQKKLRKVKLELPFFFKHLSYLLNVKPVNVALKESIDLAPSCVQADLNELLVDSLNSPNSIQPFETFISKYDTVESVKYYIYTLHSLREIDNEVRGQTLLRTFTSNITRHTLESREVKMRNITDMLQIIVSVPVLVLGYLIFNLLSLYMDVII